MEKFLLNAFPTPNLMMPMQMPSLGRAPSFSLRSNKLWRCCFPVEEQPEIVEDDAIRARISPADWLGRQTRCCFCIPMKAASVLICIMSFFWSILELQNADAITSKVVTDSGDFRLYLRTAYALCAIIFLIATAALMLGILTKSCNALNFYVWVAFLFNCIVMLLYLMAIVSLLHEENSTEQYKPLALTALFVVLYHAAVFYCIAIVNTYEVYLRMLSLTEIG